jgi:FixJ family two-component response regulator
MSATVHIVDDNASFRTSTGRLLRACGYAVETYGSGEQLLQRLPNDAASGCILLDINMPGVSGPELQERLNTLQSSLPIIFLTGCGDIPTTVQVIKAGAEDLLSKPVARDTLVQAIKRALDRAHVMRETRELVNADSRKSRTEHLDEGTVPSAVEQTRIISEARAAVEASRRLLKQTNEALDGLATDPNAARPKPEASDT